MINEMKAELELILRYTRQILEIQDGATNVVEQAQKIERSVRKLLGQSEPKICPECGYLFRRNGWDGIDSHWRAKHESIMPYAEAWPLIKAGTYRRAQKTHSTDLFQ